MGNCNTRCRGDSSDSNRKADLGGGNVQIITSKEAWDQRLSEASKDGRMVVVNFSVSWCKPCRTIAPLYRELSEKYPFLTFLTVDVDEVAEVSTSLDIKATPTFFFLKDGEEVDKLVGANKLDLQKKAIEEGSTLYLIGCLVRVAT